MKSRSLLHFTCFAVLIFGAAALYATPVFVANAAPFDSWGDACVVHEAGGTSNSPIGANISCAGSGTNASGLAFAGTGEVGASAASFNFTGTSLPARGSADASYSDFVTFHSSNPNATSVVTTMFVDAKALLAAGGEFGVAGVTFTADLDRTIVTSFSVSLDTDGNLVCNGTVGMAPACSSTFNSRLLGINVLVPLDTPVDFSLSVAALALSSEGFFSATSASADAAHTLTLPLDGPVFDLPDGFTANSADSFIVNNRFVPPGGNGTVPEPSSLMLIGTGLVGVAKVFRRKSGK